MNTKDKMSRYFLTSSIGNIRRTVKNSKLLIWALKDMLFSPFTMKTFGVLLALLMITLTTEARAYRRFKRKIEDFTKNVKTLNETEALGMSSSYIPRMDVGLNPVRSGSLGHSNFEKVKRVATWYPCADYNPCYNGGWCDKDTFECICPPSYKGDQCEKGNGPSVIARWTNNKYYSGKIVEESNDQITVMFDDGDKITHSAHDVSAVFADKAPDQMQEAQHVVAKWKGSKKYHIGFVTAITSDGYEVTLDDNDYDTYALSQLRIFPDHTSPHNEGARVFARYTNGKYYRGFVESVTSTTVHIKYDDGSSITLKKSDPSAVILDKLPCYTVVEPGQRVIAYWPGQTRYYPAKVKSKISRGSNACYQEEVYDVVFDDGAKRRENFNEIRLIP